MQMQTQKFQNKIICGDCIDILGNIDEPFADLIFADPPFNIGYKYDKYNDKVKKEKYLSWPMEGMAACKKVLKPNGSFYIAIGDDYAANIKVIADELGLVMRNWIIWHYTFGQQMKTKFARSHTHIFYFVKNKTNFTFNDHAVRTPSDRQLLYNDKRANPEGKLINDVWDEFPRICGTFNERQGWHPCQMPESLLARIIRVSSNENSWILDPFNGSGTTCVVAAKLTNYYKSLRSYTGIEISKEYSNEARKRIKKHKNRPIEGEGQRQWNPDLDHELKFLYHENNVPSGQLSQDKNELLLFATKFNSIFKKTEEPFTPNEILRRLIILRKSGKLGPLRGHSIPKKSKKI